MHKFVAEAILARKERNARLKAFKNASAKFVSNAAADNERRRVREAVRNSRARRRSALDSKCRDNRRVASAVGPTAAKRCQNKLSALSSFALACL